MKDLQFDVNTVPGTGFAGLTNGNLLQSIQDDFDVFLTLDQNLRYQQNLADFTLAVIVVCAPSNRYEDILPFLPEINDAIESVKPGDVVILSR